MATGYAGKYRRSPCPTSYSYKTFNFLRCLSLGGNVLASSQDNFSFFAGGTTIFTGRDMSPPYFAHCSQSASNLFCRKKIRMKKMWKLWPPLLKIFAVPLRLCLHACVCLLCFLQCRIVQRLSMTSFRLESLSWR